MAANARVNLGIRVDPLDFSAGNSNEELLQFIKDIDLEIGEWDFTLALHEHFAKLKAEHDAEQATKAVTGG